MPPVLPPSLSDEVPIVFPQDDDDGDVTGAEDEAREFDESGEEPEGETLPGMYRQKRHGFLTRMNN